MVRRFARGRWRSKVEAVTGGLIAALVIIGAVSGCGGHRASQSPPLTSPPGDTTASTGATSRAGTASHVRTASSIPAATRTTPTLPPRVTAVPIDRRQASNHTALALLATLSVKGRAPMTGYSRALFGPAWTDDNDDPLGHNGCDTRNDILRRDLTARVIKPGSNGCAVLAGTLADPYTATTIHFTRGGPAPAPSRSTTSSPSATPGRPAHSNGAAPGASTWPTTRSICSRSTGPPTSKKATPTPPAGYLRTAATAAPTSPAKLPSKPATDYRSPPPNTTPSPASSRGAAHTNQRPARPAVPPPGRRPEHPHPPRPRRDPHYRRPRTRRHPHHRRNVYYANCAAVRAAGKAPLYRGQPGYRSGLDRDGDGIACET